MATMRLTLVRPELLSRSVSAANEARSNRSIAGSSAPPAAHQMASSVNAYVGSERTVLQSSRSSLPSRAVEKTVAPLSS